MVTGIIALLAAFSVPNLLRARHNGSEVLAIGSCQTLGKAFQNFYARELPHTYPGSLAALNASNPPYIDPVLAGGEKQGYRFVYTLQDPEHFELRAQPVSLGHSGSRYFFLDQTGVLRVQTGAPAGPTDVPVEG